MKNTHDTIKNTVRELLTHMGVTIDDIEEVDDGIGIDRFNVRSAESARTLIGAHGETLQAINFVVKKIIEPQSKEGDDGSLNFIIDVDDYQKDRLIEIKNITKIVAERVKLFGHELPLPSMSSYERMIVHSVAQTIDGVTTESRGIGRERHVVLRVSE